MKLRHLLILPVLAAMGCQSVKTIMNRLLIIRS